MNKPSYNGSSLLVTLTISVDRDGNTTSDLQTHDNSFSEVARGLIAIKAEIERVMNNSKLCPFHPSKGVNPSAKIPRGST